MDEAAPKGMIAQRFRGFLPVVIDVECGGFNARTDAILEVAAVTLAMDDDGLLRIDERFDWAVDPFPGANLEPAALAFTGIDPSHPDRVATAETLVFGELFKALRGKVKTAGCSRAVLVGHNAHFDHGFVMAAAARAGIKRNPFHPFSVFDTATLAGLACGHTVLARACQLAGIDFSNTEAHSALYDATKTAELFCWIVNRWHVLGGWRQPPAERD